MSEQVTYPLEIRYFCTDRPSSGMEKSLAIEIRDAIADYESVTPSDIEFSITEYIDIEAVAQLKQHENSVWMLTFNVPDHEVTVTSEGDILIDDQHMKERI